MNRMNKKAVAGFEVVLMIVSLFAFMYFVGFSKENFSMVSAADDDDDQSFSEFMDGLLNGELVESESWSSYPISASASGIGCCFVSNDGQVCGTASPENCLSDSPFAEGALCADTSFCEKGCCYDEASGIYDKNVLEIACPSEWVKDPNCNLPGARLGCCVLGSESIFETRGQCEIDSSVRAIGGNEVVDWRRDVGEGECLFLGTDQKEGACVLNDGGCKFVSEGDCFSYGGDFSEGYLCSSPSLNTSCVMTEQTRCVDGKDGVYFVDSCGNIANIYDSSRIDDPSYWDKVIDPADICGDDDVEGGNANSTSCGNCNRFAGGICASALEDNFDVDAGNFYCRDTSCEFDGVSYDNGESWCVYDGAIGDGDDVVGSRHWKYVCSQGVVQVEPCADYRNQICIQSNELEVNGSMVEFSNAACVANNWRECINLNSEKDGLEKCEDTLNCRVETVDIADKFKFDVCEPEYPGGFALNDERYQRTAESLCGMADQTCTVVYKHKHSGGCKVVANKGCLSEKFAQEMNDFCRGLGDCGGAVNVIGEYSDNYEVRKSPHLSDSWIDGMKDLAVPVPGQFAEVEDYSEYLEAAGVWGVPDTPVPGEKNMEMLKTLSMIGHGVSGIGMAAGFAATGQILGYQVLSSGGFLTGSYVATDGMVWVVPGSTAASAAAFSGAMMGAGIGGIAGMMMAKQLGLSETGSMLMTIGGAMVGAAVAIHMDIMGASALLGNAATMALLWVGIALIVISLFFSMHKCPPVEVEFECRPWQAPSGGDNCDACNGDLLKPCSRYRCESLGAGCELLNEGSGDELCVSANPDDVTPPVIRRQNGVSFEGVDYEESDGGFNIVSSNGGCLEAYLPMAFGIMTSEPAQCRFDVSQVDFEEMSFDLGGNSYLYNHSAVFTLPDPSHGESQGANWTGDLDLYIKCRDRYGMVSPGYYQIHTCVQEGEDRTAPRVVASEPASGEAVGINVSSEDILIVTNELSECRWSLNDSDYFDMENSLVCDDSLGSPSNSLGYACNGSLPIGDASTDYYIRCRDQPWLNESGDRNANAESFVFSLEKASSEISIDKIKPDSDFEISSDFTTIELKVASSGGMDSHFCSYSFSGYDHMIDMFETGEDRTHTQVLNRGPGRQNIYVECRDETGDFARGLTSFNIIRDSSTPQIARVWQEGGVIDLALSEASECKFSFDGCQFAWDDGNEIGNGEDLRFSAVKGDIYYIKCADEFENMPDGCSITVQAI